MAAILLSTASIAVWVGSVPKADCPSAQIKMAGVFLMEASSVCRKKKKTGQQIHTLFKITCLSLTAVFQKNEKLPFSLIFGMYLIYCVSRKKSFLFAALYAAFILGGRHVMKQREKFELRKPLVLWSLTLAVFR